VTFAHAQSGTNTDSGIQIPADATVESLFRDFLHYARLGRFTAADAYAKTLLAHPELDPVVVLEVANEDPRAIETLFTLIKSSSIGESAARVLDLLQKGEHEKRKSRERISANIELLGGDPQQEYIAIRNLIESGEYAIPPFVDALLDTTKSHLRPRMVNALNLLGKPAVGPMVMALSMDDNDVRQHLIHALGEIGYPQAIPYLRKLIADHSMPDATKSAAAAAITRIEQIAGRTVPGSAEDLFFRLGERYYLEDDAVRADPRLDQANVWFWDETDQGLTHVVVPQRIFGQVMAMRCCQEALNLRNDHVEAMALWLAANTRREARLGLNVESADPDETGETDNTRPDVFPRALYFTQAAGPRYAHLVLERAVRDYDSAVALGAIEALRVTAGEASLVGTEDYKQPLVQALHFPDLMVRIRAALALGAALPKSQFAGSQHVMPVLTGALALSGRQQAIVVDPDESATNTVVSILRDTGRDVVGDTSFFRALDRARTEMPALTGVFVSTDIEDPGIAEAIDRLRGEFIYSKTPVVVLIKPGQYMLAQEAARMDPYVETVDANADEETLMAAFQRALDRAGPTPLSEDTALTIALQAGETLRRIAVDGRTVYDLGVAEPVLINVLSSSEERLQVLAASVLALLPTPTAQRAIAHLALDDTNPRPLRVAAFASLAESAKNFAHMLEDAQITELVRIAQKADDLVIRTAASQALGAINLATSKASEIIRSFD
jgi:HEAT repeat protein